MRWTIGMKLIAGFLAVSALAAAAGITGIWGVRSLGTDLAIIAEEEFPIVDAADEAQIALRYAEVLEAEYVLSDDVKKLDGMKEQIEQASADFRMFVAAMTYGTHDKHGQWTSAFLPHRDRWVELQGNRRVFKGNAEIQALLLKAVPAEKDFEKSTEDLEKSHKAALVQLALSQAQIKDADAQVMAAEKDIEKLVEEIERRLLEKSDAATAEQIHLLIKVEHIAILFAQMGALLDRFAVVKEIAQIGSVKVEFEEMKRDLDSTLAEVESMKLTATESANLRRVHEEYRKFLTDADHVFKEYRQYLVYEKQAKHDLEMVDKDAEEIVKDFHAVSRRAGQIMDDAVAEAKATEAEAIWLLIAVTVIAVVVGIGLGIMISRSISIPIGKVVAAADRIAEGDLSGSDIGIESTDEIGQLADAFSRMTSNLQSMVGQVVATAEQVGAASGEVSTTAQQSASGAQQQQKGVEQISTQTTEVSSQMEEISSQIEEMASGIEQASATVDSQLEFVQRVSATMEEMAASVAAVSENATKAQDQGKGAVSEAQKGQEAVRAATRGMDEISTTIGGLAKVIGSLGQRSNQIGNIVDTITGIASQTNLLALNAAIEAARAGEHGRGFAVVADEVRKLAERTAQATEEIETLVKGIQDESQNAVKSTEDGIKKVKQGDELTRNVGSVLDVIVGSIRETSDAVQGILASSEEQAKAAKDVAGAVEELTGMSQQIAKGMSEQSKGAQQISQAVAQTSKAMEETSASIQEVSGVTNQVAAGAQEMASSAEELSAQAEGLQEIMSQFTLSNGGEKAAARKTARTPRRPARERGERATGRVWQTAGRPALGSEEEEKKLKPRVHFGPQAGGNGGDGR